MTPPRSLQHEYELYVEREIENYKDSIARSALLAIGDEAVARLRAQPPTTLTEGVRGEAGDMHQRRALARAGGNADITKSPPLTSPHR